MSQQRYKVKTVAGIDLDGRILPAGREFVPKPKHADWLKLALKSGAVERVDTDEKKAAK